MRAIPKIIAIIIFIIIGVIISPAMLVTWLLGAKDPFYHFVVFADDTCEIFK